MAYPDKPRVLIVSCMYPHPRRPHRATFVHKWARQMEACGCAVRVFTVNAVTLGTYLRSPGDVWHFLRSPRRESYEWDGRRVEVAKFHLGLPIQHSDRAPHLAYRSIGPAIAAIRREFPFDVLYCANGEYLSLAASWVARDLGVPCVTTAIGSHINVCYRDRAGRRFGVEREICLNARLVVCVSEDMNRKVLEMTDGAARTWTFYSGVDPDFFAPDPQRRAAFRQRLGLGPERRLVLFLGNLIRPKGVYDLLEVFGRLRRERPELHLVLIGEAVEGKRIHQAIEAAGVKEAVTLTGAIPQSEIIGYMNACDLFVFPSWMEGLPNAVMEAASCGLPIVASRVGGVPEVVEDGRTGLLVEAREREALGEKMCALLDDPARAAALGRAARAQVLETFNWQRNGAALADRLREVIHDA